ncbi:MAG: hypothetical protein Q4D98_02350 [Planctomycetia bacterium]|nr:hypothetical protein [Planctomycetia bacterium]
MKIRDRIKAFCRVPARELMPNPKNWRTHPVAQKNALKGVLAEIGYADALLAREDEEGRLRLVDGHLRAETTPDQEVPVLVLDVTEEEADKLLATLDPLSAMAGTNRELLAALTSEIETDSDAVRALLDATLGREKTPLDTKELLVPELYQVVVECADEEHQKSVYEQLQSEGLRCRLLNL